MMRSSESLARSRKSPSSARVIEDAETHPIRSESDLDGLRAILAEIVGQSCWSADIRAGVLRLDFGRRIREEASVVPDRMHGEWSLGVWSEEWLLLPDGDPAITVSPWGNEQIDDELARPFGQLAAVELTWPECTLHLSFSTGQRIVVEHHPDHGQLEDWELWLPDRRIAKLWGPTSWALGR